MPKHLRLSADDSQHWYLPDDSDLGQVRLDVKNAVQATHDGTATVMVEVDGVRAPLLINGRTLAVCAVYETEPLGTGRPPPIVFGSS